ncbi:MAG: TRAP transporter substrate-binding protein [Desulfobacteraceae bacterium]
MTRAMRLFVMCCLSMVAAGLVMPASGFAETYEFTYSNFFPPSHIQSKLAKSWCEEVEKRTDGKVSITYYDGSSLTKPSQTYDAVVSQRADIGMSCILYTRGRFPLMDVINLPFGNPGGKFATAAFNELYDKFEPEEFSDTKVMYLHAHGPGLIHTKNKPVHSMEDLKGMKIRSGGPVADIVKALGANPVSMPMPDTYQALQKGVVEGACYPEETNKGWKMGEVIDYSIACYDTAYSTGFYVVMNKDKWNSLPADVKKTMEQVNAEWAEKHGKAWDTSDYEGIRYTLSLGNSIIGIEEDEAEKWKKAVKPVFDKYLKGTEKRGVPGKEALDYLNGMVEEYHKGKFESKYY